MTETPGTAGMTGTTGAPGTSPGTTGTTGAPGTSGTTGTPPGTPPGKAGSGTPRSTGTSPRPTTSTGVRSGRRERQRTTYQPSFMERYRTAIVVIGAIVGVALLSAFVFFSATQPAYACSTTWTPVPTASPAAGATPALGYVQPDQGATHVAVGNKVTYTYCPPASGQHYNTAIAGPIPARVYGAGDTAIPEGWIHNLEHGGLVILYTGTSAGATADGQAQFKAFYDSFPAGPVCGTPRGQIGPVVARFDQMSSPFEAIVWGRVLFLDSFDQAQILTFWNQWGEKTNPEKQCPAPSGNPSAGPSAGPSASAAPSPS